MVATWTRSSSGSPRLRNRRARCSTSGRCCSTSASRARLVAGVALLGAVQLQEQLAGPLAVDGQPRAARRRLLGRRRHPPRRRPPRPRQRPRPRRGSPGRPARCRASRHLAPGGGVGLWTVRSAAGHAGPCRAAALAQPDPHLALGVQAGVDLAGQRAEHGPGERVPLGQLAAGGGDGDGDLEGLRRQLEPAGELGGLDGVRQQHRAGLVDRDPQVLDLVEGEVEAGREPGRGGAQDREVRRVGRQPDLDRVLDDPVRAHCPTGVAPGDESFTHPRALRSSATVPRLIAGSIKARAGRSGSARLGEPDQGLAVDPVGDPLGERAGTQRLVEAPGRVPVQHPPLEPGQPALEADLGQRLQQQPPGAAAPERPAGRRGPPGRGCAPPARSSS